MKFAKTLVLAVLCVCSVAVSAAQSNILRTLLDPGRNRTFFIPLSGNTNVPDAVNFDSNARRLVICSKSEAEKCQAWPLEAKDVLPFSPEGAGARLFVAETSTTFKLCELSGITPGASLVCKSASAADLDSGNLIAKGASSLHLKFNALEAEYDCLFSSLSGFNCSTSQRLSPRSVAGIFIADFLGSRSSVQVLDLNNKTARLCEIGASCRDVEGLDLLSSAKFLAAGGYSKGGARAMLIGVSDDLNIACAMSHYSSYRIGFVCDSSVQEYPSGASVQPFSVRAAAGSAADAVVFVARRNGAAPVTGLGGVESAPAARTKAVMNLASRIAAHVGNGALKRSTDVSSEMGATISGGVTTMARIPKENIYDFSEIQVPWLFEIAFDKPLDDGLPGSERVRVDRMWSDTAGFILLIGIWSILVL